MVVFCSVIFLIFYSREIHMKWWCFDLHKYNERIENVDIQAFFSTESFYFYSMLCTQDETKIDGCYIFCSYLLSSSCFFVLIGSSSSVSLLFFFLKLTTVIDAAKNTRKPSLKLHRHSMTWRRRCGRKERELWLQTVRRKLCIPMLVPVPKGTI